MIDKTALTRFVEQTLEGTDNFLVDVRVTSDNSIIVEIDNPNGVDIDTCAKLTRDIEAEFPRDTEDYNLEVGSAGLTAPFKVAGQFLKNVGNPVDLLTADGRKLHGVLTAVEPDASSFTVTIAEKVKEPGKKRPVIVDVPHNFLRNEVKSITYRIDFK